MAAAKKKLRSSVRRQITPLEVSSISSLENLSKIAKSGEIRQASTTGFLVIVKREDLVPAQLRRNLNIDEIVGLRVLLHLPQMNIEISGKIARTRLLGKKGYEIGVDFSDDAPEYWRECLFDLLPAPGEFDDEH